VSAPVKFLLVDDIDDNRYLLAKTLLRKFPSSTCIECRTSATALAAATGERPVAVVVHRADDLDGPQLIRRMRAMGVQVPIIMVSGREDCPEAVAAGATTFLNYDAWLRIGTVVEEILGPGFVKAFTASPFQAQQDFLRLRDV
jgi:CheY-like chemotaxis protein